MAKFRVLGGDGFDLDFEQLASLKPEDIDEILTAGAEVFKTRISEYISANHSRTGTLAKSFVIRLLTPAFNTAYVEPKGKNHGKSSSTKGTRRAKTGQGKSGSRGHHGMSAGASNADVLYYLEYGTPRTPAQHIVETISEQCRDEVSAAMESAFNSILSRRGV